MIKDEEYLKSKASFCLDLAKKLGATDASVTVGNSISETVSFRNKVLDESNRSDSLAISIETYLGKKKSSITSSNLLDENLKTLIEKCFETTKITPEDEFNSLPDKELLAKNIKDLNLYDQSHIENDKKIDYLKELEETASIDKKIINTESGFTENKDFLCFLLIDHRFNQRFFMFFVITQNNLLNDLWRKLSRGINFYKFWIHKGCFDPPKLFVVKCC